MATQDRAAAAAVMQELLHNCQHFSFFQAVRLLEHSHPHSAPLGRQGPARQERIRLRPHVSLAFPTTDVEAIEPVESDDESLSHFLMTVNFLGLYGTVSPLPAFYTEEIIDADEDIRRNFLDLFHHRLLSLLYRCWEKYRYYVQYRPGATDQFSQWMFALIGLGGASSRNKSHIYWPKLLPYLGLLGMRTHSAVVLAGIISHYFGRLPVSIEQCVGRWVRFAAEQRHILGRANCSLGEDSTLGKKFYDHSGKFRLRIGALDFATFQTFLPPGTSYWAVRELVMFGMKDQLEFDVEVVLMASEIPDLLLSAESSCRLGWSTWLGPRPEHDVSVVFPGKAGQLNLGEGVEQ
jgi:type VI secretion system protein ImpH